MRHYTFNTGDSRVSPRHEVSDAAIQVVAPLLQPGSHPIPNFPGWRVKVIREPGVLLFTAFCVDVPVATCGVAAEDGEAAGVSSLACGRADFSAGTRSGFFPRFSEMPGVGIS